MKTYTVDFCGSGVDKYGVPDPFHRYLIVVGSWAHGKAFIATIHPLTGAPMPQQVNFILQWTSSAAHDVAFRAIDALTNLPENQGLERFVDTASTGVSTPRN